MGWTNFWKVYSGYIIISGNNPINKMYKQQPFDSCCVAKALGGKGSSGPEVFHQPHLGRFLSRSAGTPDTLEDGD